MSHTPDTALPADQARHGAGYSATGPADDAYAGDSPVLHSTGGDWERLAAEAVAHPEERVVVNMGPQHPSTHGVLRLILELDGETVTEARAGIGYLHTGIEKNMEFRTWVQGVTFCTRMDYLTSMFQETAYCLAVEKLLGITDQVPERASVIRVLMMELSRVSSHLVCTGTGGMEMGASTVMTMAFRDRQHLLDVIEMVTGLRMNNAYIRPGGVAQDVPPGTVDKLREILPQMRAGLVQFEKLLNENPIVKARMQNVGVLDLTGCMALGVTGPMLRSTGYPHDLRKIAPYCGYETYDFDVVTWDTADSYGRLRLRLEEIRQSLDIIEQCTDRLANNPGPVMVEDKKIAWPAQLAIGGDGMGNSLDHIREIMGESMESLIHHFKLVTEGFRVPAGQVYTAVESPKGELGCHLVSDGGTRPYRAHFRDPSFNNLQAVAALCEGGQLADVIVAVASIDPVMGGVDR
ncbi:MAG: NADH-quinone oxidoreductase subunit D [Micrococcales bacterium]|nr:NADH-quinone oxidoreductase subunit D [Micrococcales bacterium]